MFVPLSGRAIVPPSSVTSSRDVLSAHAMDVYDTPGMYALAVCKVDESNNFENPTPLPLYYVSPQVARDRNPQEDSRNGPGVQSGWYVVAESGTVFEIHFDILGLDVLREGEDATHTHIVVDNVRLGYLFSHSTMEGHTFQHCVRGPYFPTATDGLYSMKRFTFSKALKVREDEVNSDQAAVSESVSCIKLFCIAGKRVQPGDAEKMNEYMDGHLSEQTETERNFKNYDNPRTGYTGDNRSRAVSEVDAAKKGRSIRMTPQGFGNQRYTLIPSIPLTSKRDARELGITIYMREKSWMMSRKLIDSNGQPVKRSQFLEMLGGNHAGSVKREIKRGAPNGGGSSRRKKRVKRENVETKGLVKEVLDLTEEGGDD